MLDHSTFAHWSVDTTGLSVGEVADRVLAETGNWPPTGMGRGDWSPAVIDASVPRERRGAVVVRYDGRRQVDRGLSRLRQRTEVGRPGRLCRCGPGGVLQHRSER